MDPSAYQQHHQVRLIQSALPQEWHGKSLESRHTRWENATEHIEEPPNTFYPSKHTESQPRKRTRTCRTRRLTDASSDTTPRDVTGARPASVSKRLAHDIKQPTDSLDVDFVTADMLLKEADCFAFGPVFPFSTEGGKGCPFFPSSWGL